MELLLEYRNIKQEESRDNQMSCIVNLLDFYSEHSRLPIVNFKASTHFLYKEEMFACHLKKLHDLHIECENWAEASFTPRNQAAMLRDLKVVFSHGWWLDIRSNLTRWCSTDRWLSYSQRVRCGGIEQGLEQCRALYEEETVINYAMADLRWAEAELYENLMRPEPEYLRAVFYGKSFQAFLQNKIVVYRERGFERLPDFQSRLLNQVTHQCISMSEKRLMVSTERPK